eukprot:jgi/Botrbrau1/4936/Bobra.0122s0018.1
MALGRSLMLLLSSKFKPPMKAREQGGGGQARAAQTTACCASSRKLWRSWCRTLGQPRYRAKQISDALLHGARTIDDLVTLPKTFREALMEAGLRTGRSLIHAESASKDGTRKDGRVIETCGIPVDEENHRASLSVVSSQVLRVPLFTSTERKGARARNLLAHEIVDQSHRAGRIRFPRQQRRVPSAKAMNTFYNIYKSALRCMAMPLCSLDQSPCGQVKAFLLRG